MLYVDFNAGIKEYRLKMSTRATVALEKQLGCNPLAIFGSGDRIPTVTEMVAILHSALQQYEHGITMADAYDIFDNWLEDGHVITDFIPVILDIYRASGIIKPENKTEDEGKNV